MSKIDVRRLQMLARQRQKLEEEAAQLQAEVDAMVLPSFPLLRSALRTLSMKQINGLKECKSS